MRREPVACDLEGTLDRGAFLPADSGSESRTAICPEGAEDEKYHACVPSSVTMVIGAVQVDSGGENSRHLPLKRPFCPALVQSLLLVGRRLLAGQENMARLSLTALIVVILQ
jgi:hypothetical protein